MMSSIAAECEPRLCARCVEQCWAVSGDSDVYPMSAGTNSGGKTHVLRQEVTVAKWSVLKRTSTGLRRYVELRLKCAEITKNADSTRRARARPPLPAFGRLSNVPFPIETTAARRDAFVVFRVTFFCESSFASRLVRLPISPGCPPRVRSAPLRWPSARRSCA